MALMARIVLSCAPTAEAVTVTFSRGAAFAVLVSTGPSECPGPAAGVCVKGLCSQHGASSQT